MNDSLRVFVQRIAKLPTLPQIAQDILNLINDDMVSVSRLESIIEKDPTISARILSVANSAFFGTGRPVTSVSNAIIRIGFNNVKYISLGVALMTVHGRERLDLPLDSRRIFQHSIAVGFVGKALAGVVADVDPDDAFVGGILHDIGLLVLNSYFEVAYRSVIEEFLTIPSLLDAERKVLGFTHDEIGYWLADKWNLPDMILDVINYHHRPSSAVRNRSVVSLVHIADVVTSDHFFRICEKNPSYELDASSLGLLNLSPERLHAFVAGFDRSIFEGEIFKL